MDLSIVICTRNRANQLRQALAAIERVQTQRDWEAVIVDNGSTDETAAVIGEMAKRCHRIRYVFEAEPGLGAARDTGWRAAAGTILSFTDDDCYVATDYVDAVCQAFTERDDAGFIGGKISLFDPSDAPVTIDLRQEPVVIPPRIFVPTGALQGANISYRRSTLERIGGFDRRLGAGTPYPCEDIDAVAAAVWAGIGGAYDPRPTVAHHHGRKQEDVCKLNASYDAGRGAYYMKYLGRPDSREVYLQNWSRQSFGKGWNAFRLAGEVDAALRFHGEMKTHAGRGLIAGLKMLKLGLNGLVGLRNVLSALKPRWKQ